MKSREQFVANSSTTSFCIVGSYVDNYRELDPGEEKAWDLGLSVYSPDYYDGAYIGLSIGRMGDDETMVEFKRRAKTLLEEFGLSYEDGKLPSIIVEGWRDG